jgi:hypothetical protein
VPRAQLGALSVAASGAFVSPAPLAPPLPVPFAAGAPGVNFALGVTNATFHRILREKGSIPTAAPFLISLLGNVTLAPHPGLPPGGFNVTRPVTIISQRGGVTGIDFGGRVRGAGSAGGGRGPWAQRRGAF